MSLPSLSYAGDGVGAKPRIQVLEVRDRDKPENEPLAWLLIERHETSEYNGKDGSVCKASIHLSFQRIVPKYAHNTKDKGDFYGSYSQLHNWVSLVSSSYHDGAVFLDLPGLQGQRIGTYLMNEIVIWARRWPEATVRSVTLLPAQAYPENRARRNRFYERFGLVFDYSDENHEAGKSRPMLAGALTPVESWKANIREIGLLDYLADVLDARNLASSELLHRERGIRGLLEDRRKAEAKPLQWALRELWSRYRGNIIAGVFIAVIAAVAWTQWKT